jgi:hypothetical protein
VNESPEGLPDETPEPARDGHEDVDQAEADRGAADLQSHKRFRAATDDELDPQSYLISDDRSALRAVLRGGSVAQDRGNAEFVGGAIRRLARVLREAAESYRMAGSEFLSGPLLRRVQFGASVTLDLEIGQDEDVQAGVDNARHAPTIEAARAVVELLAADAEELVPRAVKFRTETVAAYKQFLNHLAEDDVTLEWLPADATQVVVYTSVDARRDFAILDRQGEQHTETAVVPGTLTMADSRRRRFELTLPPQLKRPPLLQRKQTVEGPYADEMGERLKREGLWDSEVIATIEVTYDVPGTTASPRDPVYRLVDAEPLLPTVARLF